MSTYEACLINSYTLEILKVRKHENIKLKEQSEFCTYGIKILLINVTAERMLKRVRPMD